jgi:hypothetical protein
MVRAAAACYVTPVVKACWALTAARAVRYHDFMRTARDSERVSIAFVHGRACVAVVAYNI